ncbi:hypothetical protein CVT25_006253 [Psilocybe cyanescens]|uniref:Uncharacterized protein n=1 Tax=Psilocybe cyanescens TaxID=93625 RepID=A0A409WYS0_PSICY|nr:hypothetical protein CVT25_006253 [Psilocybe cyanescens]
MVSSSVDACRIAPQEIIDNIIDEVAHQTPQSKGQSTLRVCSLVSQSFASQCATKLVRMLKGKNSVTRTGFETRSLTLDLVWEPEDPGHEAERPGLLQSIKKHFKPEFGIFDIFESFEIVFEDSEPRQKHPNIPHQIALLRTIRRLFRRQYDIFDLFRMLKKTPNLRHVSVTNIRERTHFFWGQGEFSLQPALLQLYQAANSNLKPFTLCNITPSSKVLVTAAFFLKSIRELTLHGNLSPSLDHLSLSKLVSLRHFKFQSATPGTVAWVEDCQCTLLRIFTIRDFSSKLESIELQFVFSAMWSHTKGTSLKRFKQAEHWNMIDQLFTGDEFINLELLEISQQRSGCESLLETS